MFVEPPPPAEHRKLGFFGICSGIKMMFWFYYSSMDTILVATIAAWVGTAIPAPQLYHRHHESPRLRSVADQITCPGVKPAGLIHWYMASFHELWTKSLNSIPC